MSPRPGRVLAVLLLLALPAASQTAPDPAARVRTGQAQAREWERASRIQRVDPGSVEAAAAGEVTRELVEANPEVRSLAPSLEIRLYRNPEPDARAFPGGLVYLSDSLVRQWLLGGPGSPTFAGELAGVLGHELAHLGLDHDLAVPSGDQERQADLYGALFCLRAGYDPAHFVRFLERVERGGARSSARYPDLASRVRDLVEYRALKLNALRAHWEWGTQAFRAQRYEQAVAHFDQVLLVLPELPSAWASRGAAVFGAWQQARPPGPWRYGPEVAARPSFRLRGSEPSLEQAEADFRRALQLDPHSVEALEGLASTAMARGSAGQAAEWLARVLEQEPDRASSLNLAGVLAWPDDAGRANTLFRRALAIQPGYLPALFNLARVAGAMGQAAEADRWRRLYLQQDPRSPWSRLLSSAAPAGPRPPAPLLEALPGLGAETLARAWGAPDEVLDLGAFQEWRLDEPPVRLLLQEGVVACAVWSGGGPVGDTPARLRAAWGPEEAGYPGPQGTQDLVWLARDSTAEVRDGRVVEVRLWSP